MNASRLIRSPDSSARSIAPAPLEDLSDHRQEDAVGAPRNGFPGRVTQPTAAAAVAARTIANTRGMTCDFTPRSACESTACTVCDTAGRNFASGDSVTATLGAIAPTGIFGTENCNEATTGSLARSWVIRFSSRRTCWAFSGRSSGFFARNWWMSVQRAGGRSGRSSDKGAGTSFKCFIANRLVLYYFLHLKH